MNVKFRYIIYIACIICIDFWTFSLSSYAYKSYWSVGEVNGVWRVLNSWYMEDNNNTKFCFLRSSSGSYTLYSNSADTFTVSFNRRPIGTNQEPETTTEYTIVPSRQGNTDIFLCHNNGINWGYQNFDSNISIFTNMGDVENYLINGILPSLPYDDDLNLDSFKISYYLWSSTLTSPHYRFNVTWSDSNIYQVQVKIYSTRSGQSWEGTSSPFSNTFIGSNVAQVNGDVVHCVATPYKQDGTYGNSLYYSFTFDGNDPLTNVWRKYNNTPYQNNIIDIPYTGVSGNEVVQAPVDGITQNYNYKVNYNPVTNEYGDLVLNEIYYSPVVIYEDNTPSEVVEQTQNYITNNYTTNNYYDATNNIDYDYDFDFGDVSGSDIQNRYNGVGDFFNGFGTFIGKLANLLSGLFPFLSPAVATWLIAGVAFILALGVIMIFIKIVGAIKDVIPFL